MKQTLHILGKDARRSWRDIALVVSLCAVYASLPPGAGVFGLLPLATLLACWKLAASVVQEDGPVKDSPFWLTRPYGRGNLIAAKVLFAFVFVFVPVFLSGLVITVRVGAGITANLGNLIAMDLFRWLFLTLPGLGIGAVTSSFRQLLGYAAILLVIWSATDIYSSIHGGFAFSTFPFSSSDNVAALALAAAGLIAVFGMQFVWRKTGWARAVLAASFVISGFLMPIEGVAQLSTRATATIDGWHFQPSLVRISFDESQPPRDEPRIGTIDCYSIPMKVEGLPEDARLRAENDYGGDFSWPQVDGYGMSLRDTAAGYRMTVCGAGFEKALRASVEFEVVSTKRIAEAPLRDGVFRAGDAGRCTVRTGEVPVELRCELVKGVDGTFAAGLEFSGYRSYTRGWSYLSPWIAPAPVREIRFAGPAASTQVWDTDTAMLHPEARLVLRSERVIGYVRRELVYHGLASRLKGLPSA